MEHDNENKLLGLLQSNLIMPMKDEMKKNTDAVSRLRLRLLILKVVIALGISLHVWCGFLETHSWLWPLYILILMVI